MIKIPDPNDSWAAVELHRWQFGELPAQDDKREMIPSEGLRGMANALKEKDQSKWPAPFNVASVLEYAAKLLEKNVPIISSEAVEIVCDLLSDEIHSCDGGEEDREKFLMEAKTFLWSFHFTNNK
jgi:hypothetical protein